MKIQSYLLGLLALATIGVAALAWSQHLELIKLRNGDKLSDAERNALQKKSLAAEKKQHELEEQLAALRARRSGDQAGDPAAGADAQAGDNRQRGRNNRFNNFATLMNDPVFNKLMTAQEKAMLDSRFGSLFKQLGNLTPAQLDQFKNLLLEEQNAARDAFQVAMSQGLNPRENRSEINQLISQSNADVESQIQSTLGPDGYAQYQNYMQTLPAQNTLNMLQTDLGGNNSLTDAQAAQVMNILGENTPKNANPTSVGALMRGGNGPLGGPNTTITSSMLPQLESVLTPAQYQAVLDVQNLQNAMRPNRQNGTTAQASTAQAPAK